MENNSNEVYAGIIRSDIGDYHLYLLTGTEGRLDWNDATARATSLGGYLPSTDEQTLLSSNCRSHFKEGFYWSSTLYARDPYYAYVMRFTDGTIANFPKLHEYQIAVVRREFITKETELTGAEFVARVPNPRMSEATLRDEFAGRAMQSFIDSRFNTNLYAADFSKQCATIAYKFADAMMEERSK